MSSPPSFSKLARGPIATVTIKPSGAAYRIHKDLICHYSAYFERALVIKHADEVTFDEHVSVYTMDLFVDWLYTDKLDMNNDIWTYPQGMLNAAVFGHTCTASLFHAAVHNAIVDHLVKKKTVLGSSSINFVFQCLPKDNALRELFVELEYRYGTGVYDDTKLPEEFVQMVDAKRGERGFSKVKELDACEWHIHGSEKEKSECETMARDRV